MSGRVSHVAQNFRNRDKMELLPGMIFTIEPILTGMLSSSRFFEIKSGRGFVQRYASKLIFNHFMPILSISLK